MNESEVQRERYEQAVIDCVVRSIDEVAFHEKFESPDADLVHREGFHVGLEIVRAVDEQAHSVKNRLPDLTERLRAALEAQAIRGVFWVYFDLHFLPPNISDAEYRQWRREIGDRFAGFVTARGTGRIEQQELERHGIRGIACVELERSTNTFVGMGYSTRSIGGLTLVGRALRSKHDKLARYRARNGDRFQEYWLAIVGWGAGVMEDGGYEMLFSRQYETSYDRVLLIEIGSHGSFERAVDVTPTRSGASMNTRGTDVDR